MTKFPDIFQALMAPFPKKEVKERSGGGGRMLSYITARTAMNRLDAVLGPENWSDRYYEVCQVLFCEITIRLPDGTTVSKSDAGGFKEMKEGGRVDEENTDKTGASDAFKRAAAKFGVARYLYKDGLPELASSPPAEAQNSLPKANGKAAPGKVNPPGGSEPAGGKARTWEQFVLDGCNHYQKEEGITVKAVSVHRDVYRWAIAEGHVEGVMDADDVAIDQMVDDLSRLYTMEPEASKGMRAQVKLYLKGVAAGI